LRAKKILFKSPDGTDMTATFDEFAQSIGLEDVAANRYSGLLLAQLYGASFGFIHSSRVIAEIKALEGVAGKSVLKPPIQNKYPPLKGLWHKHFLQDDLRSFAMNVKKGMSSFGVPLFEARMREAEISGVERLVTLDDVPSLVNDIIHGNLNRLGEVQKITGEWLVFAKHNGANYYLCIATHDVSTHEDIRNQINVVCCEEFPFLVDLLQSA